MVPHYDRTELIHRTLHTVRQNMIEGIGLVVLVLVLFLGLGNYRTALVVALAVPVSLLGAYLLLDLRGIPANLISMGAIDFGIIVDSAVVIAENLIRILHERKDKPQSLPGAIVEAVREMGRPILFSKAILLTAFIPVYTLQRVEGRIFRPMALTLTYALVTGTIFAVFVVPALLSFAVRHGTQEGDSWIVRKLIQLYRPVLNFALSCRKLIFAGTGRSARLRRPGLLLPRLRVPAQAGRRRPLGAHLHAQVHFALRGRQDRPQCPPPPRLVPGDRERAQPTGPPG